MKNIFFNILLFVSAVALTSCEDDLAAEQEQPTAPYVLSLGVTSSGNTTYYVVSTDNLMEGTINAVGKEKGYTYIIDNAAGTIVYLGADAIDASKDVKAKLGIKK